MIVSKGEVTIVVLRSHKRYVVHERYVGVTRVLRERYTGVMSQKFVKRLMNLSYFDFKIW